MVTACARPPARGLEAPQRREVGKPTRGAKYYMPVLFDAPDAHIRLNHKCE